MATRLVLGVKNILGATKLKLSLPEEYDPFDEQIIDYINSAFAQLHSLGVGPDSMFQIETGDEVWDEFDNAAPYTNLVKTYVYLYVRRLFDPPPSGFVTDAMEKQIKEHEWRLNVAYEEYKTWGS